VTLIDRELDGRNHNLAESDDVLRILTQTDDGRTVEYAYRGFRFTIERGTVMWWCHQRLLPARKPDGLEHEAGWGSLTHRAVVRKVTRGIRKDERARARRYEMGDTW
jgi:hypothetical protein